MNAIEVDRMLDAAAHRLIIERCRRAYLHDMRGGLQAIAGAFELLTRLAKSGESNPTMVEKASAIARRALANHEHAMLEMVEQITCEKNDSTEAIDLGELINDIIRFLRNDIASKQIGASVSHSGHLIVQAQKHRLRLVLLGLIAQRIDDCPAGAEMRIRLDRSNGNAALELRCALAPDSRDEHPALEPHDLVLDMARQWLTTHGGRMELRGDMPGQADLKIFYPLLLDPTPAVS
jgi:K+-sensing histidine kinase KdpD